MTGLIHDLRQALRTARRHPGFSSFVVLAMALGIGLNGAVFSLVDALLLRPPAVADPARLVHVYSSVPGDFLSHAPMAFPDYEAIRDGAQTLSGVAAYAWYPLALERGGESELVLAEAVSGGYFATLGVVPALGRALDLTDDAPGAARPVAVLSHEGWHRHFAAAADVVGRALRLNGRAFVVVGVAPRDFRSLVPGLCPDLWLPIHAAVALPTGVTITFGGVTPGVSRTADRLQRWVWMTGRLRPDVTVAHAQAELSVLASRLGREFPATNAQRAFVAASTRDVRLLPGIDRAAWRGSMLVTGLFALGLLLASVNLAGLFLARALGRRREIATRLAIGAQRRQILRQLFVEGLLLALAGGALGLTLVRASNAALGRLDLPLASGVNWPLDLVLAPGLDLRVVSYTLAAAIVSAAVFALLPALEATRPDLTAMLREIGASAPSGSSPRLRAALVAAQVAVSVVLIGAAGVAARTLLRATRVDPGFDPERAAVVTLSPDLLGYSPEEGERLFTRVQERVTAIPGVRGAAFASHLPLTAAVNFGNIAVEGGHADHDTLVELASVAPGYFETMGISLVAGRPFADTDGPGAPGVVIVNEALGRRLWPASPPLGRRLRDGSVVVGVARDGKYRTLGEAPRPFLYRCLGQDPRGTRTLVVRAAADPRPLLPAIRAAIRELDARVPVSGARTLGETVAGALFVPRLAAALLGFFGALGLVLVAVGTFGVVACVGSARRREIGVRLALGASRAAILRWLVRRGLAPTVAGLAAGVGATVAAARALSGFSVGAWPLDPYALAAAISLLAAVAAVATLGPAWRAARADPAEALRQE